jgi:predicted Zn-dependent protease
MSGLHEPQNLAGIALGAAERGLLDDARTLLEGLLVVEPLDGFLYDCLGCVYLCMKRRPEALSAFERALELDPTDRVARRYLEELAREPAEELWHELSQQSRAALVESCARWCGPLSRS